MEDLAVCETFLFVHELHEKHEALCFRGFRGQALLPLALKQFLAGFFEAGALGGSEAADAGLGDFIE